MIDLTVYTRTTQEDALQECLTEMNPMTIQKRIEMVGVDEYMMADFFASLVGEYSPDIARAVCEGFLLGVQFVRQVDKEEEEETTDVPC